MTHDKVSWIEHQVDKFCMSGGSKVSGSFAGETLRYHGLASTHKE